MSISSLQRIVRHLLWTEGRVARAFPPRSLAAIESAIQASEKEHLGEVRFAVEGGLDGAPLFSGQSARDRAVDLFSQLRIWDTEYNTGLLIYLLLADQAVEIVADRGIAARVGGPAWAQVCRDMEAAFARSDFEGGVVGGVQAVTRHLMKHFPADAPGGNSIGGSGNLNELPDTPVVIRGR